MLEAYFEAFYLCYGAAGSVTAIFQAKFYGKSLLDRRLEPGRWLPYTKPALDFVP